MKTVCVIPARYGSTRFPGKPLVKLNGRPMIEWVCRAAGQVKVIDEVLVATDDDRIAKAVRDSGFEPIMTDPELPSGTDRIHAAVKDREADIVVNLQGDEPLMPAAAVEAAHAALLETNSDAATACVPITRREDFEAPQIVKVVCGQNGLALYFSRAPVPSPARREPEETSQPGFVWGYKHLGLYLYRRDALRRFCLLTPSQLENIEKLEQLRLLENGMSLVCVTTDADSVGIDVPEDVPRVEKLLRERFQ